MSRFQYGLLSMSSFLSVCLALTLLGLDLYNKHLESNQITTQSEITSLQAELNRGSTSQKFLQQIVQDLLSVTNNKAEIQALLARYGITTKK